MLNRSYVVALAMLTACKVPDGAFIKAAEDAGSEAGEADTGDAGTLQCERLGFPSVSLPTGQTPQSVAVADVSGDSKPDLVVANFGAATVSVLLGNGNGTFQLKVDYPTGSFPQSIAVADVSGDGKPDLIVANDGGDTVSVLLGNGNGTFQTKVDYSTGSRPVSVAVADVSNDGKLDLVVANSGGGAGNTLSVLHGNGNGTFQAKIDYLAGSAPNSMAIGDMSGDGELDLVVANFYDATVSVLLGNGNGTFQAKVDYPTGSRPASVAIADVNGNGRPDLIVANNGPGTLSVLLGNGGGTFQGKIDYPTGLGPTSVAVGDVSGDGKLDLVVANYNASLGNTVSVLPGTGNGTFQAKVDYPTGSGPASVAVADVSGDGKLDLVVANSEDYIVSVLVATCLP